MRKKPILKRLLAVIGIGARRWLATLLTSLTPGLAELSSSWTITALMLTAVTVIGASRPRPGSSARFAAATHTVDDGADSVLATADDPPPPASNQTAHPVTRPR
jgi:hypothetical protein